MSKYDILYGKSSSDGIIELKGINQVAEFIVTEGKKGDVEVYSDDHSLYISTFGTYLSKITDLEYRDELLKELIPLQKKCEREAGLGECCCDE